MSLTENYFSLFDLPEKYGLDTDHLAEKYFLLQKKTHPDRFANASKRDQLLSAQYAAVVNDAYEALKSPLNRAIYMLKLNGLELDDQQTAKMSPDFLMQQIELREELESVKTNSDPATRLSAFSERLYGQLALYEQELARLFNESTETGLNQAVETVNKMQFIVKLLRDVEHLEDELLDN